MRRIEVVASTFGYHSINGQASDNPEALHGTLVSDAQRALIDAALESDERAKEIIALVNKEVP